MMKKIRSLLIIKTTRNDQYFAPPLAILQYLLLLTLVVFACYDFIVNQRYARIDTGVATIGGSTTPSMTRNPRLPFQTAPDYCTNPTYSWDMQDVFLQAGLGRLCMANYSCGVYFPDDTIFHATETEWQLYTALGGLPVPGAMPNTEQFDIRPLFLPNFTTLTPAAKEALLDSIFQGLHRFNCTPSYFTENPDQVNVRVTHRVQAGQGLGTQSQMETFLYDTDENLIRTFGEDEPVIFTMAEVFKVDWDVPHPMVQSFQLPDTIPDHLKTPLPPITIRSVGLAGELNFFYTNIWDQALNSRLRCHIRPKLDYFQLGLLKTGFFPVENVAEGKIEPAPFAGRGLKIAITYNSAFGGPNFYDTILYLVSLSVLAGAVDALVKGILSILKTCKKIKKLPDEKDSDSEGEEGGDDSSNDTVDDNKKSGGKKRKLENGVFLPCEPVKKDSVNTGQQTSSFCPPKPTSSRTAPTERTQQNPVFDVRVSDMEGDNQ